MAEGAWVPVYDSLWESQKTTRLARELKIPIEIAGAKFLKLCAWARDHVESGELGKVADRSLLAKACGLAAGRGDELYRALQIARFITDDERGYIVGWEDGPGKLVESRRVDRLRKAHDRGAHDGRLVGGCPKCARAAVGTAMSQAPATVPAGTSQPSSSHVTGTSQPSTGNSSSGRPVPVPGASTGQHPSASTDKKESADLSNGRPSDAGNLSTRRETRETTETRETRTSPPPPSQDGAVAPDEQDVAARLAWVLASVGEDHRWRDVVAELAKTHPIRNVETWFPKTRAEAYGDALVVVVPNAFAAEWVSNRYTKRIREALTALGMAQPLTISVLTEEQLATSKAEHAKQQSADLEIPDAPAADVDQPYARVRDGGAA